MATIAVKRIKKKQENDGKLKQKTNDNNNTNLFLMLSHVFVARTSRIEMAAIATNRRQHIVSMAKKSHHSDLMQVSPISVRVSYLMLLM